jgi:hypothetical protein
MSIAQNASIVDIDIVKKRRGAMTNTKQQTAEILLLFSILITFMTFIYMWVLMIEKV